MDPVSASVMISAGISSIGKLFKGFMGWQAGKAQERQAKAAAAQANAEAGVKAQASLDELDRTEAEGAVRAADNGGGLSGSTQDVLADIDRRGMFNARSLIWAGATRANNALYEGKLARRQGALDLVGGVIGAGSSVAGGWADKARLSAGSGAGAGA